MVPEGHYPFSGFHQAPFAVVTLQSAFKGRQAAFQSQKLPEVALSVLFLIDLATLVIPRVGVKVRLPTLMTNTEQMPTWGAENVPFHMGVAEDTFHAVQPAASRPFLKMKI